MDERDRVVAKFREHIGDFNNKQINDIAGIVSDEMQFRLATSQLLQKNNL